jgi:hypothetical protein
LGLSVSLALEGEIIGIERPLDRAHREERRSGVCRRSVELRQRDVTVVVVHP